MASPTFSFTPLNEPSSNTTTTLPTDYDGDMALLLGACCQTTYLQYATAAVPTASQITTSFSDLLTTSQGQDVVLTPTNIVGLTASEANGPQSSSNTIGDYTTIPAGFIATFTQTGLSSLPSSFIVVAIRGTQTWAEWIDDADAYPTQFDEDAYGLAFVHGGFYGYYTTGPLGTVSSNPLGTGSSGRVAGSIAAQVASYFSGGNTLPVYVTGHSLGGAVAALCAWDIAAFVAKDTHVSMYSLAAPRPVMGLTVSIISAPTSNVTSNYQKLVPKSFRIVNACDIVPTLPPSTIVDNSTFVITTGHVTDNQTSPDTDVVSFCCQTGDIGGNHSCQFTYLPYLALMAPINQDSSVSSA